MKKRLLVSSALVLLSLVGSTSANETLLGPKKYLRTRGKPNVYRDTFSSLESREGFLKILNGDKDGKYRISSAIITVNDEQVAGPRDFNQGIESLRIPVDIRATNTISVQLRGGGKGHYLTVEVALPFSEEIPAWRMPELAVTGLSVEPERAKRGHRVELCAIVSNIGKGATPQSTLVLSIDSAEVLREQIGSLEPGTDAQTCHHWVAAGPGKHLVRAELELEPEDIDFNTSNNFEIATARVADGLPDLEFLDLDTEALQLIPGQSATIPLRARNPGFNAIDEIPIDFYIDDVLVLQAAIKNLPGGGVAEFPIPWESVTLGEHSVTVRDRVGDAFPVFQFIHSWRIVVPDQTLLYDTLENSKWVSLGPSILENNWAGRMNSIAFHPNKPIFYTSGLATDADIPAGPGVWKTNNGGGSWKPLGDKLPSMLQRAVAVDPKYPDKIVYAGGPEGIVKSVDGGTTWSIFAHKNAVKDVREIDVSYLSSSEVLIYVATDDGVYRYKSTTPDAQFSHSVGWDRIKQGKVLDLAVHPNNNSMVYASIASDGLYRTSVGDQAKEETTQGDHDWFQLTNGLPTITKQRSLTLDFNETYPNVVYAGIARPDSETYFAIYRSFDGGDSWKAIKQYASGDLDEKDCSVYNPYVRVVPTSTPGDILTEIVYFGGVCLFQFIHYEPLIEKTKVPEGGTYMVSGYHVEMRAGVDMKALEIDPASKSQTQKYYYSVGDQGIFRCSVDTSPRQLTLKDKLFGESGDQCSHRNTDLRVTEFYDFDVSSKSNKVIGGTQDTGTVLYNGDLKWKMIKGGDGMYSLINPDDDNILYAQHQSLDSTVRSSNGGKNWKARFFHWLPEAYGPGGAWITMNPLFSDAIIAKGTGSVIFYSVNGGSTWNGLHIGHHTYGKATKVIVHPKTLDWLIGTTKGTILLNPRDSLNVIPIFTHPQKALVESLSVSPSDSTNLLFVAFRTGSAYKNNRFYYIEMDHDDLSKSTVHNITGNFPVNLAPRVIVGDPNEAYVAYVGTDKGVWRWKLATGGSFKWKPYNDGLPLTTVVDLQIAPGPDDMSILLAATKGRGAWRVITKP